MYLTEFAPSNLTENKDKELYLTRIFSQ